ncbi:hypothetical protein PAAG_11432 [Paracoccidioides lutzii Pb01]|uniref:Uncharacterized protein n=1 Tax=Paracoccidioides lutzii (strain ATCC MYA-826 / Pb01) TaxID=502779 RepID=A0A0A2V232_PARBA|nr:hypothetical protein PAAG_11432 [Paracoccidioides lutzii Pb01]KGQ01856.1 hypothetical protein PAAG_11432 [Paracoccidioides lutzii Pb01]
MLAFSSLGMSIIPFASIRYGQHIRQNSKFCQHLHQQKEADRNSEEEEEDRSRNFSDRCWQGRGERTNHQHPIPAPKPNQTLDIDFITSGYNEEMELYPRIIFQDVFIYDNYIFRLLSKTSHRPDDRTDHTAPVTVGI